MGYWALDEEDKEHGGWGDKEQDLIIVLSPCPPSGTLREPATLLLSETLREREAAPRLRVYAVACGGASAVLGSPP
jgi:hypothetical protein